MLEKSHNTSQRSSTFTSLKEACYYQSIYGGKVYTISECQTELNEVDEDEFETKETEGTKYYVLSVSEKKTLINGFMYIKELLLQYHNFKMYEAYKTLSANNIKVYSVKTDCLTIHEDDVDKVYGYNFVVCGEKDCLNLELTSALGDWKRRKQLHCLRSYTHTSLTKCRKSRKLVISKLKLRTSGILKQSARKLC